MRRSRITLVVVPLLTLLPLLGGCATLPGLGDAGVAPIAALPSPGPAVAETVGPPEAAAPSEGPSPAEVALPPALSRDDSSAAPFTLLAQAKGQSAEEVVPEDYDPWEPFNEKMFAFNRALDRWVLKPAANVYRHIMPEPFQIVIANGFDNIRFVPRLVNSLLQQKWGGAGREVARFAINSTAGIGGLFDPAGDYFGIKRSREDFGQTLSVYGAGPGPYLILPVLPPLTVRDGIGRAVDGAMDPVAYVLPFLFDRLGMQLGDMLNDRALNYDLFQGFEESTIDMYSAVRDAYLRRREQLIKE